MPTWWYVPSSTTATTTGTTIYYTPSDYTTSSGTTATWSRYQSTGATAVTITYNWEPRYEWRDPGVEDQRTMARRGYAEMRAAQQRREHRDAVLAVAREEQRAAAEKAEELLRSCLSVEQVECLEANQYFDVDGSSGGHYRIYRGYAGNVARDRYRYCAHGAHDLPEPDHMLMQKLAIETDEEAFLAVANRS